MITRLDILGSLIESLQRDELNQEQMLAYCVENEPILQSNIEQALTQYTLDQLRTFGKTDHPNQDEFASFISTWKRS